MEDWRQAGSTPTLRCTGKSAEIIDGKGLGRAPLRQRVRKYMKTQGMKKAAHFANGVNELEQSGSNIQ